MPLPERLRGSNPVVSIMVELGENVRPVYEFTWVADSQPESASSIDSSLKSQDTDESDRRTDDIEEDAAPSAISQFLTGVSETDAALGLRSESETETLAELGRRDDDCEVELVGYET